MQRVVDDFRPSTARWLADGGAVALVPFGVWDLLSGRSYLGIAMLVLAVALRGAAWLLGTGWYSPLAVVAVFGVPMTAFNAVATARYGFHNTYWAFVIVLALFLVLPQRWAWATSFLLIAVVSPVTWWENGSAVGSRFAVCMLLLSAFAGVAVHLIDDRQRMLLEQLVTDPLTGVLNRMTLRDRLVASIDRARTTRGRASILTVDVDHFKRVNDQHGHDAGDRVLAGLASVLRAHVRDDVDVFRLGGEEFLVLLEGATIAEAEGVAARLVDVVARHRFLDGCPVTVSIGVAELIAGESSNDWMRRSDQALYRAKASGRNTVASS